MTDQLQQVLDQTFYLKFDRARRYLLARGVAIEKAQRSSAIYWVNMGQGDFMCTRWDVIYLARQQGLQDIDFATGEVAPAGEV